MEAKTEEAATIQDPLVKGEEDMRGLDRSRNGGNRQKTGIKEDEN